MLCQRRETMKQNRIYSLSFMALMTALVFVSNYISVPFFSSRLHVANAGCLLAALLFGGKKGFLIAGLGSALFDLTFPAFVAEAPITFLNKGLMALICGLIFYGETKSSLKLYLASLAAALGYVALYILKSYIQKRFIAPIPLETIAPMLLQKLSAASINAAFAVIVAPLLFRATHLGLSKAGLMKYIEAK